MYIYIYAVYIYIYIYDYDRRRCIVNDLWRCVLNARFLLTANSVGYRKCRDAARPFYIQREPCRTRSRALHTRHVAASKAVQSNRRRDTLFILCHTHVCHARHSLGCHIPASSACTKPPASALLAALGKQGAMGSFLHAPPCISPRGSAR